MKVAITGATGFLGRYIVAKMASAGNRCRCWYRLESDRGGFDNAAAIEWCAGRLGDARSCCELVEGCDAVVHAGLQRAGTEFRGGEGDVSEFVKTNVVGTIELIEAARAAGARRFIYISTCAVHEKILSDRPLDETHPLWATTHYGAHKAAVEQFVHSYGLGFGYDICAVRPTGIYGTARPVEHSKWYDLVRSVTSDGRVHCERGGKEVHAADVAAAVDLLLHADGIAGEVYSCCDRYVSQLDVATLAREISGSNATITGHQTRPKNRIVCDKIKALGMRFGGDQRLRQTIEELVRGCS